ncbi:MAG: hypothetical protein IJX80_09445 [Clostridia bacterium]|nr:hypothetical protein [Clostridia bacterium]
MVIKSGGENAYFAASNSVSGFFSYYDAIFNAARIGRVYAIKGGPGTGKSRFLREVATCAETAGWETEYIYCSSDPYSLDAVILSKEGQESIALLDATAPHVYEPSCPGAREELVNLGDFWNAELLIERKEEIEALNRAKKEAYRQAYRYLAGLGEMNANRDSTVEPFVRRDRIRAFAERLMQDVRAEETFLPMPALMHSVGMRGEVGFDTYFSDAKKIYVIEDCRGAARYLMEALGELARDLRLKVRISHDPVEPEKLDGLFLCGSGIAFAVCSSEACDFPHKRISMRRFVDTVSMKTLKKSLNFTERMRRAMRQGALDSLERVREVHFRIEEIYMSAMDFDAKEQFTKNFCNRLFGLQKE